jgi:hypothetical protein
VARLRRPVRGQPQKPTLTGRAAWRAGTYTAPVVAPFTVGTLTAATAATATLAPGDRAAGALGASTAASSALTATATAAGTDSYPDIYYSDVYPPAPAGVLTATDQRTGGPG